MISCTYDQSDLQIFYEIYLLESLILIGIYLENKIGIISR